MASLSHFKITVTNYRRSREFYDKLFAELGWSSAHADGVVAGYSSGECSIWLQEGENTNTKFSRENVGLDHVAFKVSSKEEVDEFAGWLKKNKIELLCAPKYYPEYSNNYYAVFFLDPDNIILEVTTHD